MDNWLWLLQLAPILTLLYYYVHQKYIYWQRMGVKGPTPHLYTFGNTFQIAGHSCPPKNEVELVGKYGKVYGTFMGLEPTLTVADAEVIKRIMVKDFHLFVNKRANRGYHEMVNTNQFVTEGDKWKRLRSITSPSFTSGKLRSMFPLKHKCVTQLVEFLDKMATGESGGLINTKEVFIGFTLDVIATTSFATETNVNNDRSISNPLVNQAIRFQAVNPLQVLSFTAMPAWFNNRVGAQHPFNFESMDYLRDLSAQVLAERRKNKGKRNDFVQLLMDAFVYESDLRNSNYDKLEITDKEKEGQTDEKIRSPNQNKNKLNDIEILSQSILFFGAGFETTAAALTHSIFEFSRHPDVQERLCEELVEALDGMDEQSEEYLEKVINNIPYLDAVIKETLRKYPVLVRLERRYNGDEEYKIQGIPLYKEQLIEVSTYAVHYNPEYYPEPERFNPDRFMPENKHLLVPYTYLPFGVGPRNCVGMRFAYQEIKLCLAKIVRQFRFVATGQTPSSLQFDTFKFLTSTKPFTTRVEKRL